MSTKSCKPPKFPRGEQLHKIIAERMQLDCSQQGEPPIPPGMKARGDGSRVRGVISLGAVIYSMKGIKSPKVNGPNGKQDG